LKIYVQSIFQTNDDLKKSGWSLYRLNYAECNIQNFIWISQLTQSNNFS